MEMEHVFKTDHILSHTAGFSKYLRIEIETVPHKVKKKSILKPYTIGWPETGK